MQEKDEHVMLSIQLSRQLVEVLPISRLLADLHSDLAQRANPTVYIQVETGIIEVPHDVSADIIAHVVQYDSLTDNVWFRANLAVGGIERYSHGIVTPRLCFARLMYDADFVFQYVEYFVGLLG